MENLLNVNSIFELIILVFVSYLVIKFIWSMFSTAIKIIFFILVVVVGVWIVKPNYIEKIVGKESKSHIEKRTQETIKNSQKEVEKTIKKL